MGPTRKNGGNKLAASYLIIPIVVALGTRAIFYLSWVNSTFKYYSFVKGLDMQTLLSWGVGAATNGESANNLYVYLISLVVELANGSIFTIDIIIIFQLFLGIGTVVLSAYIAWIITESKVTASVSGVLTACYAPLLMYEGFMLKNTLCTFLTTSLLLMALLLYKRTKYARVFALCSGFFAGLLLFANFASICFVLFVYLWQIFVTFKMKRSLKSLATYPITVLIVLVVVFAATGFKFFPIINNIADARWISYAINVGAQREITTLNESIQSLEQTSGKPIDFYPYLKKTFTLLSSAEVPDNINYHFVKDGIIPLGYMLSPFLLYTIGIPALFLYIGMCRDRKIPLICGGYFVSIVLPLIIFVPLSRYTVVYSPLLCTVSAWLIFEFIRCISKKDVKVTLFIVILLLASFAIQIRLNPAPFCRASDFVTFAKALEVKNPGDSRIAYAYEEAYKIDPESIQIALKYSDMLMGQGRFSEASDILEKLYNVNSHNARIALRLVSSLLGCKKTNEAGALLDTLTEISAIDNVLHLYNRAEYFFQKENYKDALKLYEQLGLLNATAIQEKVKQRVFFIRAVVNR